MLLKESNHLAKPEKLGIDPSISSYTGLTALNTLPEHRNVRLAATGENIQVHIDNRDGYSVSAVLRQPLQTDFQSHPDKLEQAKGQLLFAKDIAIVTPRKNIQLLEEFQKAYPAYQPATIALEASASHLQGLLRINDVFARALYYASRGDRNTRGNTANHKESNSVRLDIFPSTDLTIFFLIHELTELSLQQQQSSQQIVDAKARLDQAFYAAKELLVAAKIIEPSVSPGVVIQKILEMAVKSGGKDTAEKVIIDCAAQYHWYVATKKMAVADNEKKVNDDTFAFVMNVLPGLIEDQQRISRLQRMVAILNRWYDRQVTVPQFKIEDLSPGSKEYDFASFFNTRKYAVPVDSLDSTLKTWVALCTSSRI
jgi:hypothetical protein